MAASDNGAHVTWRELNLLVGPIMTQLEEIGEDVKTLLKEKNERRGAERARVGFIESRRFVIGATIALVGALLASTATLVWLAVG